MKKRIYKLLSVVILSVMTGCSTASGTSDRVSNQTSQVDKVLQQQVERTESQKQNRVETEQVAPTDTADQITAKPVQITDVPVQITDVPEQGTDISDQITSVSDQISDASNQIATPQGKQTSENIPEYKKVDIDLTELSSTLVYSEVYNMMSVPEEYIGKTVRMEGDFYTYYAENQNQYYFACIIRDATACCAQGIEFVLAGDYVYPNDYPEEGSFVRVTGVFDTYVDEPYTYCTLRNAIFE